MTISELNAKIAEAPDSEWFNKIDVVIKYSHSENVLKFKTVIDLYEYVYNQIEGLSQIKPSPPVAVIKNSLTLFQEVKAAIITFVGLTQAQLSSPRPNHWRSTQKSISALKDSFPYNAPEVPFLIDISKEGVDVVNAAIQYLRNENFEVNTNDKFKGALYAYEFRLGEKSNLFSRQLAESASIGKLKNEFQQYFIDAKQETEKLKTEAQAKIDYHNISIKEDYKNYADSFEKYKEKVKEEVANWFSQAKNEYGEFNITSIAGFKELKSTYEEHLRLEKPAQYWNKRSQQLKKEGQTALIWLVGLVMFACISLYCLLWLTPEGMLLSFIKGNASALKWSIVYVTFISFLAFAIRAVSKVMFSSFHLARDAEEREQLTFVYLAMIKDASIDEKDRLLVMQSLFSRADTGLLKDDSTPTMPGGLAEKFFMK